MIMMTSHSNRNSGITPKSRGENKRLIWTGACDMTYELAVARTDLTSTPIPLYLPLIVKWQLHHGCTCRSAQAML